MVEGGARNTSASCRSAFSGCQSRCARRRPSSIRGGGDRQGDGGAARSTSRTSGRRASATRRTRTRPKDFDWDAWLGPGAERSRTTRTARSTASAGSTTTPAGSSPTSASTTSRRSTRRSASTRRWRSSAHRRQVRQLRQPRSARHDGGALALPRRHAGDVLAVQRDRRAPPAARAVRDRVPRHEGDAVLPHRTATRSCRRSITPNEFAARDADRPRHGEGLAHRARRPQIEAKKVDGQIKDADHARNFLDCVKSRKTPTCDIEFGHRCTTAALDRQHRAPDEERTWNGTRRPSGSPTTTRRTSC